MTLPSRSGSSSRRSIMSWQTVTLFFLVLGQQLGDHLCAHLAHYEIFSDDAPDTVLVFLLFFFSTLYRCLALLEAMFYGRMPFLTLTLVASYDTQGYGVSILTGAYTGTSTHWYSFRRPRKDDRLSQPPGVNLVENGVQTQDPRIPSQPP